MKQFVLDIEANGLDPDTVWCIVVQQIGGHDDSLTWSGDRLPEFITWLQLQDECELIGHNLIGYDIPVLEKLLAVDFSKCKITDTLVMSRLANPSREGGHSLDNWGTVLNCPKGDHNVWDVFSYDMLEYCIQDVKVNTLVYQRLLLELKGFKPESIDLEHQVQGVISKQIKTGWLLDQGKAYNLLATLKEKKNDLEDEVHEVFKPLPTFVKEITPKIKKDGTLSVVGLKFLGEQWETAVAPFSRIDFPIFNLGSRQQIGRHLQYYGWKPKQFTETGQAIVDEAVLGTVKGIPQAALIAEYLMIQKRVAQVQSWLEAVKEDGRVHGYVNANGAVTGRMTHSSPNMGQVPAVYSPYGKECRDVWTVPEGYKLVGMDASGLELRMLAHYMNDEGYTNEILTGDIHTANQLASGLETRDQAKTFIYAFLYGAGDAKIGSIVGGTAKDGKRLKEKFLGNTPSLGRLRERVGVASGRGYVLGLDGRRVYVRSQHAALNTLLQSAGAIVMKKALCLLNEYAILWGIDYNFIGNIHDEIQTEVREDKSEVFGGLATSCVEAAGTYYKLNCPLAGEFKVGDSWADTH
ncbi:MAG: DNA polymerase [Flavobacteriaceae bacterium]|nr:DNA polymerase [Flavobacteriaceae bacterium]